MPRSIIAGIGDIDEIRLYRASKILNTASKLLDNDLADQIPPELVIDVYYSFYAPLPVVEDDAVELLETGDPFDATRYTVITMLLSNVNLWRLKPFTTSDPLTSLIASASFIEKLSRYLPQSERPTQRTGARQGESGTGGSGRSSTIREQEIRQAIEKALEAAANDVKTAKSIKQLIAKMGIGKTSILEFDDTAEEIIKLARSTDISRILDKVEGIKVASSKNRHSSRSPRGWVEGIEYGNDIERIHPSQLALPEEYLYSALADNRLLLYTKKMDLSRGPIYVLLDKSGSMVGSKIDWARAVAVALFKKSVEENRLFYARFFDSVAYQPIAMRPRSKPREVVKLLSYLARVRAGGGTDITRATSAAVDDIISLGSRSREDRISDIVLITDGEDKVSVDILRRILKRGSVRLHTVMVQGDNPYLRAASYRYMVVKKLAGSEALKVLDFD